jgi:tetratricopeptide (TPR) repeat protein
MTPIHSHDYIQSYEASLEALKTRPLDRDLQYKAVLALARAGALDFAISEYHRYGLAAVRNHEDIMALNGRLSKDLFLRSTGPQALEYARDAARKYEDAFQNTLGYYSGINSATMSFMADMPNDHVNARIEAIEDLLPVSQGETPSQHYYIEATRAECFLLKGKVAKAVAALNEAIDFDPLNYAAHATTLKQFKMICNKQGKNADWLSAFRPPRPLHYAGHIRLKESGFDRQSLKVSISDALQYRDVGFGFGALAAGSDILFGESLLEQGAELHVVLPCEEALFKRESVTPFGENWERRFDACLSCASSVRIFSRAELWPEQNLNRLSGLSAMGLAVLQGRSLSVEPLQMLILNDGYGESYTSDHAEDWALNGHSQFRFSDGGHETFRAAALTGNFEIPCAIKQSGESGLECQYQDVVTAVEATLKRHSGQGSVQTALDLSIDGLDTGVRLEEILGAAQPQSVLSSESFASVLAAISGDKYKIIYAGQVKSQLSEAMRCYTIQRAPG